MEAQGALSSAGIRGGKYGSRARTQVRLGFRLLACYGSTCIRLTVRTNASLSVGLSDTVEHTDAGVEAHTHTHTVSNTHVRTHVSRPDPNSPSTRKVIVG